MKTDTAKKTVETANAAGRSFLYSGNDAKNLSIAASGILDALEPRTYRKLIAWQATLLGIAVLLTVALYLLGRTTDVRRYLSPMMDEGTVVGPTIVTVKKEEIPPPNAVPASPAEELSAVAIIAEAPQAPAVPATTGEPLAGLEAKPRQATAADAGSKEPSSAAKDKTAMLRICSGLRGKDPACPGDQSPGN